MVPGRWYLARESGRACVRPFEFVRQTYGYRAGVFGSIYHEGIGGYVLVVMRSEDGREVLMPPHCVRRPLEGEP